MRSYSCSSLPPQMAAAQPLVVTMYGDSHSSPSHLGQCDFGPNIHLLTFERARGRDFFISMADHPSRISNAFAHPPSPPPVPSLRPTLSMT